MKQLYFVFAVLIFLGAKTSFSEGFYISTEMGGNGVFPLNMNGEDNDLPSYCDKYLGSTVAKCKKQDSTWTNNFKFALGNLSALAVGYGFRDDLRLEAEYLFRHTSYDEAAGIDEAGVDIRQKLDNEITLAKDYIYSSDSHQLFVNVYYDRKIKEFIPYIGLGAGVAMTHLGYGAVFARNIDPAKIKTENVDKNRLAGTVTVEHSKLSSMIYGFQLLGGVDFYMTQKTALGVKLRFVKFLNEFSDGNTWDLLRSHASNNGPGTKEVRYTLNIKDIQYAGVSLVLKHFFQ